MIEVLVIPVVSLVAALGVIGLLAYSLERRRQNKKCCLIIKDQRKWLGIFLLALMVGCSNGDKEPSSVSGAEDSKAISFPSIPSFPSVFSPVATKPTPTTSTTTTTTKVRSETCKYNGRYNGDRATFYCNKNMNQYPSKLTVVIPGCVTKTISNNGKRYESGGLIVKQSEVSGRGMAIVIEKSCKSTSAGIRY